MALLIDGNTRRTISIRRLPSLGAAFVGKQVQKMLGRNSKGPAPGSPELLFAGDTSGEDISPPRLGDSDIQCIPPEIMSEIFVFCYASNPPQGIVGGNVGAPHNIPIYLTHICASWRHLALHTPELWSSVTLCFNELRVQSTRAIIEFTDAWLAKGLPGKLTLHIDMDFLYDFHNNAIDKAPIMRLIVERAGEWQKLSVTRCPDSMAKELIMHMTQNSFPSLEEIELHTFASISDILFQPLTPLPRLRRVHFRTWRLPSLPHELTFLFLPWHQLKALVIATPVSGLASLTQLAHCNELVTLELYIICDVIGGLERITLPVLSELCLTSFSTSDGRSVESFLRRLDLPALRHLDLYFIGPDPWNPLSSAFWEAHSYQLQTLILPNLSFHSDLRLLFRTTPNLASLKSTSRGIRFAAQDFDALRGQSLLPKLKSLDVAVGNAPGVRPIESVRAAVSLLEVRSAVGTEANVACLVDAKLADCMNWDGVCGDVDELDLPELDVELQRLQLLKAEGINIQWQRKGQFLAL
ncbi:hypothetical protein B0H11DRAFT_1952175 [Mycena galericulata]|nr:hypothetical protein B0H11DRAFT_1952175 [Mycena galericulata]